MIATSLATFRENQGHFPYDGGRSITGKPPVDRLVFDAGTPTVVVNGTVHLADPTAALAQTDFL